MMEYQPNNPPSQMDIFIDESCHLEHDHIPVMCIGYIKVAQQEYSEIRERFNSLKLKYRTLSELKWNKFSNSRIPYYQALIDLFFNSTLEFRCILVKYKDRLNHADFNQGSHDNFYYKLIYHLIKINKEDFRYRVFLDIKDTRGKEKLAKIEEILQNHYQQNSPFIHFQHIRSEDNIFIQLADFFIGAVAYKARVVSGNIKDKHAGRMELVRYLEKRSGFNLEEGTPPWEAKFNIFDHQPKVKD